MEKAGTPVLETRRLILRGHLESDLADCAAMWGDPGVVRYIGNKPFSMEEVWVKLLLYVGHWQMKGFGYWVVEEKTSGRFAGEIGFADFKREIMPALGSAPELGWVLDTWAHGKGYATEAVGEAITWSKTNMPEARMGTDRTVCLIHPENTASIRLAAKFDFREWERTMYKGSPVILFERLQRRL